MMKYPIASLLLLLLVGNLHAQTRLSLSEIQEFKQMVLNKAEQTTTIFSDFTQQKHLDFLENDILSSGTLAFKSPETVKWSYTSPFNYAVLFEGGKLFVDDAGKKSTVNVGGSPLFKRLSKLIVQSVRGDMFDTQEFNIQYLKSADGVVVELDSKDAGFKKYITRFVLHFNDTYQVYQVKMIEPTGDYTLISFTNRKDNIQFDEKQFLH